MLTGIHPMHILNFPMVYQIRKDLPVVMNGVGKSQKDPAALGIAEGRHEPVLPHWHNPWESASKSTQRFKLSSSFMIVNVRPAISRDVK